MIGSDSGQLQMITGMSEFTVILVLKVPLEVRRNISNKIHYESPVKREPIQTSMVQQALFADWCHKDKELFSWPDMQ